MIGSPLLLSDDGYNIQRSVRLRSSASAYFSRTPGSASNQQKWTWSGWAKRGALSTFGLMAAPTAGQPMSFGIYQDQFYLTVSGVGTATSTQVFRDPSAHYHFVVVLDTAQVSGPNRLIVYCNGVQVVLSGLTLTQSASYAINSVTPHQIGTSAVSGSAQYADGYLSEVNFIDGQALTPASFGETDPATGSWKPKKYAGTYGTNGYYLDFRDNSAATAAAIGADRSGNGNNWTPTGVSVTAGATYDSMLDVPTMWGDGGNGRGNYCTLNPILQNAWWAAPSRGAISNGNLTLSQNNGTAFSTFDVTATGKWYAEVTIGSYGQTSAASSIIVAARSNSTFATLYYANGNKALQTTVSAYGASWTTGDVIGVAVDPALNQVTFYKNGVSQGTLTNTFPAETVLLGYYAEATGTDTVHFNFGQRPFSYTPPTGFKCLHTGNLPEPVINKPADWFNAVTATGANIKTTAEALYSGSQYLEWIKDRANANNHQLLDTVRGTTAVLQSNTTAAETTYSAPAGSSVAWVWKEGALPGFDIVTYTGNGVSGRTIAHSLGAAPKMIFAKARNNAYEWKVWHTSLASGNQLILNSTAGQAADSSVWTTTLPTGSVFSVGSNVAINQNTATYVAYLFSEVAGFSKIGSYTGNGSADGPFVYCGFRPKIVMVKNTSATGAWMIFDTARSTTNATDDVLEANTSNAEAANLTDNLIDALSNGFKLRGTQANGNASGNTYVFAAFAESPFKTALAR